MPSLLPNLFIFMRNEKKTDAILNEKSFFRLQVSEENLCGGFYLSFAFAKIKRSVDFKFAFSCSSFKKMRRKFNDELNLSMA